MQTVEELQKVLEEKTAKLSEERKVNEEKLANERADKEKAAAEEREERLEAKRVSEEKVRLRKIAEQDLVKLLAAYELLDEIKLVVKEKGIKHENNTKTV